MQELDVQNAAAAEQHLKDMADYEVKLTEAAAAWEADRKKKKGKAKDEVSHHNVLLCKTWHACHATRPLPCSSHAQSLAMHQLVKCALLQIPSMRVS